MAKTVFITGASRGIGRATALSFARAGWRVGFGYLHAAAEAQSLLTELKGMGAMAEGVSADVADFCQTRGMIDRVRQALGPIAALVNNAGLAHSALFCDTTPEIWRRMFDVNVTGAYNCTQHVLDSMREAGRGSIVNVSSIWGIAGASCEVAYSASKAALIGFTKALAKEVGPAGIRVNCVAPGVIKTDMNAGLSPSELDCLVENTPLMRLGAPEDVAETILWLCSKEASFITGQIISPNGGFLI